VSFADAVHDDEGEGVSDADVLTMCGMDAGGAEALLDAVRELDFAGEIEGTDDDMPDGT
jgi:hypothetical protein